MYVVPSSRLPDGVVCVGCCLLQSTVYETLYLLNIIPLVLSLFKTYPVSPIARTLPWKTRL